MRDVDAPLRNGAELIVRSPRLREGGHVVLAELKNRPHPFVTWIEDDEGNTSRGNYFETLPEARYDYDTRYRQVA